MKLTDDRLRADANNLTLVRLVLASGVIWTHCYQIIHGVSAVDEFKPWLGAPISWFAVDGFFFLSGFLVYRSLVRRNDVAEFALARFARMWPGLAVAVALIVAVGWFFTSATSLSAYFGRETLRFILGNLSFVKAYYTLTGVQCGAALCNVNEVLWTIPWEVRCYILLGLLGLTGLASEWWLKRLILPASLAFALLFHVPAVHQLLTDRLGEGIVYNLTQIDRLWSMFALGIAAYVWRNRIPLSWAIFALLIVFTLLANLAQIDYHVGSLLAAYGVLCGGFLTARNGSISANWSDYSYGMYIYAAPVMVLLYHSGLFAHHTTLALVNLLLTIPLAMLSWHYVERPALERVKRRSLPNVPSSGETVAERAR